MDWFWKLIEFDPSELEGLGSAGQSILEMIPVIMGIVVIIGVFLAFNKKGRGEEEEGEVETEGLTGLDLEIAEIRKLQKKRL